MVRKIYPQMGDLTPCRVRAGAVQKLVPGAAGTAHAVPWIPPAIKKHFGLYKIWAWLNMKVIQVSGVAPPEYNLGTMFLSFLLEVPGATFRVPCFEPRVTLGEPLAVSWESGLPQPSQQLFP